MKTSLSLVVLLGSCGPTVTPPVPAAALIACDAYEACVDGAALTGQEREWQRWESQSRDLCFEREEDPVVCERQCLQSYADFVRPRPPETGCDPLAVLHRHRYLGRAYPKPGVVDAQVFSFWMTFVDIDSGTVTLELGEVGGDAPAVVICSRVTEVGFVCEAESGPRGLTVLQGAIHQWETDITGDFVLTEDDGDVVEWWFMADLSD